MPSEMELIATRIRRWRDEASLTLQDLADSAGVSASTIHKVENNQTVPTLTVFLKIAAGLGRSPGDLLDTDVKPGMVMVTRADERLVVGPLDGHRLERVVGELLNSELDMWRSTIQPGVAADMAPLKGEGESILLVEAGELRVWVDEEEYLLAPGDAIHHKSSLGRRTINDGDVPVVILVSMTARRGGVKSERHLQEFLGDVTDSE
jgi:transcriptional regulator with XRE-family HTH domain